MGTGDHVRLRIDGVSFRLAAPADLSFLRRYGRVFRVFDDHDSGNISFGLDDGARKWFVKIAGLDTVESVTTPAAAVATLRAAERVYRDLAHPHIVPLRETIDIPPCFGLVFDWVDGDVLRRVNTPTFNQFRALPVATRLAAMQTVVEVMQHIHHKGYVAIDLYDASFLYHFASSTLMACDIDLCARAPYVNTMGRMWGSARFMSPEEHQRGAVIDEITNVYTLGAIAFLFFGDERTRQRQDWDAGDTLFAIACRATSDDRGARYQTIAAFAEEWTSAAARALPGA